jgi:hypothetical protein
VLSGHPLIGKKVALNGDDPASIVGGWARHGQSGRRKAISTVRNGIETAPSRLYSLRKILSSRRAAADFVTGPN